jgi:hypothetical protein
MEGRKIRDAGDARRCLAAAEASGQPRAGWARENGIDARSLNAWHINLNRGRPPRPGPRQPVPARGGLRLVELLAAPAPAAPVTYRVRCGVFEVDVPGEIDEVRLGQLLRVVWSSC